jgi:hypothetical protein
MSSLLVDREYLGGSGMLSSGRTGTKAGTMAMVMALAALCLGTSAAVAVADPSTVIGQWRFDEGAGQSAVDDGPFALDGRLGLTDAVDARDPDRVAGSSGGALHFEGGTFVRLPAATELEPTTLTLEAVVRASASPGLYRYVVSHGAQGCVAGSYGLYTGEHGGMAFYVFDGQEFHVTAQIAPADVWNGAWHHVAGTFDGSSLRLLVDGHPVGQPVPAPPTIAYALTSTDHYFGTYQGTCALPLRGDVDLVRMWHGALASDFLAGLSDAALAPTPTPVVLPTTVPTATDEQSQGDAPASRSTITPVAEGTVYPAALGGVAGSGTVASTPGAPARACVVKSSGGRLRAGQATTLTVKVALRGKPLKAVRVVAMAAAKRRVGQAKTAKDGRARLRLKPAAHGKITLKVAGRQDCASTTLSVLKAAAKR